MTQTGAIYHLHVRSGSRATGDSARGTAAYIQRIGTYARARYRPAELVYAESGHMPAWAGETALTYWDAADLYERVNGRLFKRLEFALPLLLTVAEQRTLATGFTHALTDPERLPYTLALHASGGTNPYGVLLISERVNDRIARPPERWFRRYNPDHPARGGARKTTALRPRAWLDTTREAWAAQTNQALERAGHAIRIDHRSYAEQGITDRLPGIHIGPNVLAMEQRGVQTDRGTDAIRRAELNEQLSDLDAEIAELHTHEEAPS